MKQTKQGSRPEQRAEKLNPPKWAGKKAECPRCGAEYQLEAKDKPRDLKVERSPEGKWRAEFGCLTQIAGTTEAPEFRCDGLLVVEGRNNE